MRRSGTQERDRYAPSLQTFFGHGVYGREGRKLGVVRSVRAGRFGGNQPYAILELVGFSRQSAEMRAVPSDALAFDAERSCFHCDLSELSVRGAPAYTGSSDWLDGRWTARLDEHFDRSR
jgi:hypothetical protein